MALPFTEWSPEKPASVSGGPVGPSSGEVSVSSNYWSSTTNANNEDNAWNVNFNNGNDNNNNKSNSRYVRAVRGGKGFGEVFAADFRDRIVHHLIVRRLEPIWEPCFIHDSYACRVEKGTHAAVNRLRSFMGKVTRSQKRPAYYMQLDIRSFFMSIDKAILFALLKRKITDPDLLDLTEKVIFHDPTQDYVLKGDPSLLDKVPPHKSLFHVGPDKGLPIGNLTSQFFANLYLNELDQFVKHGLRCRFYLRYVDDFILLDPSPDRLMAWRDQIREFLAQRLRLELKNDGVLRRVSDGADFLGYIVRPNYTLVRRRVVHNLRHRLDQFRERLIRPIRLPGLDALEMDISPEATAQVRQVLASYLGHFKHANAFHLIQAIFKRHDWLNHLFEFQNGRLTDRLRHKGVFRSFPTQATWYKSRFPEAVLLFQVGLYIEAYEEDAMFLHQQLNLKLKPNSRKMRHTTGFPRRLEKHFTSAILKKTGRSVVHVKETGPGKYVKERWPERLIVRTADNHDDYDAADVWRSSWSSANCQNRR